MHMVLCIRSSHVQGLAALGHGMHAKGQKKRLHDIKVRCREARECNVMNTNDRSRHLSTVGGIYFEIKLFDIGLP